MTSRLQGLKPKKGHEHEIVIGKVEFSGSSKLEGAPQVFTLTDGIEVSDHTGVPVEPQNTGLSDAAMQLNLESVANWLRMKSIGETVILSTKNRRSSAPTNHDPPELARYLMWFLPKKYREEKTGDLEEEYNQIANQFSVQKANFWYWCQVVGSFCSVGMVKTIISSTLGYAASEIKRRLLH